jgi:hypothetical protein
MLSFRDVLIQVAIRSLPLIVAWMNRHHFGVTTVVPANATGGAVPNLAVSK